MLRDVSLRVGFDLSVVKAVGGCHLVPSIPVRVCIPGQVALHRYDEVQRLWEPQTPALTSAANSSTLDAATSTFSGLLGWNRVVSRAMCLQVLT
eukprot:1917246-Rhodomonas_salina.2